MTDKVIELNAGTSYWIDFKSTKDGRKLKIAGTIINVDGRLMAEAFDGHRFELPQQMIHAHPMNEFQRLRWLANSHKRTGNTDKSDALLEDSYHVMESSFYMTRIEHLTRVWAGRSNGLLQDYVDELARFRPDLPIDQLTFVREQNAKRAAFEENDTAELESANPAWGLKRFAKGVGKMFGLNV